MEMGEYWMGGLTCVFRLEVALRGELGIDFFYEH